MKELIEYMAKALVDDPDQVHVEEIEGTSATIYELLFPLRFSKNFLLKKNCNGSYMTRGYR